MIHAALTVPIRRPDNKHNRDNTKTPMIDKTERYHEYKASRKIERRFKRALWLGVAG
jgi:hypothetical protein